MTHKERFYPESRFGGFTDVDGTIAFYARVQSLVDPRSVVLDVGCGRGAQAEDPVGFRRSLRNFRGRVDRVIGIDVDPAGGANPFIDEFRRLDGEEWPVGESTVDLAFADCVLEHVEDPDSFFRSAYRVLRPGGALCIRTTNAWSYVAVAARLIPNRHHARVTARVQERRQAEDVFPTVYRCNSVPRLRAALRRNGFDGVAYGFEAEPSYLEFSRLAYRAGVLHQRWAPRFLRPVLHAFCAGREAGRGQARRMTRLLFVNQYFPPDEAATAQILGDLVQDAVRAGFECRVVTSDRGYADPTRRYPRRETWKGAAIERVRATGFGRANSLGRAMDYATFVLNAAVRLLSGPRPDVVVGLSTPPLLGALAVLAGRLRGARSVYWAMDVYPDVAFALGVVAPESLSGKFLATLSNWTVRSADLVVALGDTMGAFLRRQGASRVAVVHNWADDEAIRPNAPGASAFRAARGWGSRLVVVYSGNLGLAHEFETVLEAAERLRPQPVTFAFIGDGPRRGEVERSVAARRLPNVEFHPGIPRSALGDSLGAADLHLVTLRPGMQGLLVPSKIYGILAAGVPTLYVGPPEGEVFEIVTRARCGVTIAPGDAAALEAAILAYAADPERRTREGEAARTLLDTEFRRPRQTGSLLEELGALAGV